MADILHGNASANQLNATTDKTQLYGLAGNDTLTSDGKSNVLLVGGSGNDSLIMSSGNGTLSGGAGADTFELNYSATQTLSAIIEDVEPSSDKIVVNFDGTATPTLSSVASGSDVVLSDSDGRLAVTLKGVRENDYFDGTASDEAWEVLKLTNDEREAQGLSQLTASEGLTAGASVRAQEITTLFDHTRPDGTNWSTVLEKSYSAYGENIAEGQNSAASVVTSWMNSTGHRANILNSDYQKLGVGYYYEDTLDYEHYWVQMFGSTLTTPETVSTSNLLTTPVEVNNVSKVIQLANGGATYCNTVEGATIIGGTGNDNVTNRSTNVSISGGIGNDTIVNFYGQNTTIDGGDDEDKIQNDAANVSISGGAGNDTINNTSSQSTENVTIDSGDGNDEIYNSSDLVTINADAGDDFIISGGSKVSINAGAGSDSLTNSDSNVTINGGVGNDSINLDSTAANNLIQYASGDGNDTVSGFDSDDTLQIGGGTGTYSTQVSGSDIIVSVGTGSILLTGAASLGSSLNIAGTDNTDTTPPDTTPSSLLITLTEGDDTYSNSVASATIEALGGNDSIDNGYASVSISGATGSDTIYSNGDNVTIDGGAGDDHIYNNAFVSLPGNGGSNVSINSGTGDDTVYNSKSFVTVDGGADNDFIVTDGENVIIDGGTGNDWLQNASDNVSINGGAGDDRFNDFGNGVESVTINGGQGDDRISFMDGSANNLIQYATGDGNDTISNFDVTDTLQIGGGTGTYSTQTSGSDVIVSVGSGSILLQGAASLGSSLNIAGTDNTDTTPPDTTPANPLLITLTEGDDTYSNTIDGATILALGGNDSIANGGYNSTLGSNVSISGAAGNDTIFNWSGDNSTVYGGTGDDSIFNNANSVIIDGGSGNDSLWNSQYEWSAVASATMRGGEGNDAIWNYSDSVTVDGGAGNDSLWSTNNFISLSGGAGSDSIYNDGGDNDTINGGTGNDYIRLITSLASAQNNIIQYAAGDGNDTIQGFRADSTLQIGGGTGTYSTQTSGSDVIVSVGDGSIRLLDAASLSAINIAGEEVATVDPLNIVGTEGADNISNSLASATIAALGGNDTVDNTGARVSISGGADNDSIKNSGVRSTLLGDAGADRIENSGVLSTIFGGRGNDEISLSSSAANSYIQYEPGDGNDTIWGNDTNTTLRIMSDNARPINTGDDIVYYIGEGSIRLIGARIRPPHVVLNASGTSGGGSGSSGGSGGSSSSGSGGSGSSGSGSSGSSGGSGGSSGSSSGGSGSGGTSGTSSSRPPVNSSSSRTSSGTSSSVGYVSTNRKDSIASAAARRLYNEMTATNQPTQQTTAATTQNVYTGGNQVISNYQSGEKIIFGTDYTGAFYDAAGNFFAGSSTGALAIENAMDKVIDLRDAAGNDFVKAYAATTAGVIDGRGIAGFELINGSAGADAIYAGDGGSQLWGGADVATDILVGGNGADVFIGGRTQGADLIVNASSRDMVYLSDANLNDIIATEENNGVVAVAFNTGNVVAVQSSELLSAKFLLADGSSYRYNHADKSWQSA